MTTTAFPPLCPTEPPRAFGAPALHTDNDLLALGIAADGTLWSVEESGLLRQWSLNTRRQVNQWPLDEEATVWAFNWAGRLLASGSSEVDVWEISSGEQLVGWRADSWVTALAFQPFVPVLATGHDDGVVRVWDWADRKLLHQFPGHANAVSAVAFSWDRTRLATAGEDRAIHLWDLNTGKKAGTLEGHTDRIPALVWHPDNRRLFSAGWDTTVRVWDVLALAPLILLNSHASQVHAVALSGDGKLLASADSGQSVHVWDTDGYKPVRVLRQRGGEVRVLCFTPDDGKGNARAPLLAYGGADRLIHLWSGEQPPEAGDDLSGWAVALSPDGGRLFGLGGGAELRGWDVAGGAQAFTLAESPALRTMALSPDGRVVAAARVESAPDDRASMAMYDADSGARLAACEGQPGPITSLAFSDAGLLAAGGLRSCDVWLWDVPSAGPRLILTDAAEQCAVQALAFRPGGGVLAVAGINHLATAGGDGQVVLWSVPSGKRLLSLAGGATSVAWSPDGGHLAAGALNRKVRLYDAATGEVVREMAGHADTVTAVAYSPGGRWLASAGDDRTVRLWDEDGSQAGAWELDNQVKALAFSPDGRWLFTGNGNGSCYQIEVGRLLDPMA